MIDTMTGAGLDDSLARQVVTARIVDVVRGQGFALCELVHNDKGGRAREGSGVKAVLPLDEVPDDEIMPGVPRVRPGARMQLLVIEPGSPAAGKRAAGLPVLSASSELLVQRILEGLVPELLPTQTGPEEFDPPRVTVKGIARRAGVTGRTKIAVAPSVEGVDAIEACLGLRATRKDKLVELLFGEKVEFVPWASSPEKYLRNALAPGTVMDVLISGRYAVVSAEPHMMSVVVGKGGLNTELAGRLTGLWVQAVAYDPHLSPEENRAALEKILAAKVAEHAAARADRPAPNQPASNQPAETTEPPAPAETATEPAA
ncbi:hypothetical protein [Bailinhaonella thermotolerans]|uniref:Transcription factor NusA first KH domain-containing protein n=1 Tax=Bailinhaonella thermotolerans TaxID=1070861 RepID=A0A3A4A7R0_9ACTN|nr:hypothetical protein [Bailinhaonella thermotolerans]RJL23969.1 hypothetical protein D5H75_31545 [Bailinhaonella thermotolerans]